MRRISCSTLALVIGLLTIAAWIAVANLVDLDDDFMPAPGEAKSAIKKAPSQPRGDGPRHRGISSRRQRRHVGDLRELLLHSRTGRDTRRTRWAYVQEAEGDDTALAVLALRASKQLGFLEQLRPHCETMECVTHDVYLYATENSVITKRLAERFKVLDGLLEEHDRNPSVRNDLDWEVQVSLELVGIGEDAEAIRHAVDLLQSPPAHVREVSDGMLRIADMLDEVADLMELGIVRMDPSLFVSKRAELLSALSEQTRLIGSMCE